jgi:hypothetical protein
MQPQKPQAPEVWLAIIRPLFAVRRVEVVTVVVMSLL